ncbi:MAG: hypothetical protein IJ642_05560 [Oscillospiraceae bacterium]|nr:hypothetical protein [Oscillospiraceae bacterium]
MRIVDIYYLDANQNPVFLTGDCIQTDHADVSRKSNAKSYTMADGSLTLYPAQNDSAEFTLYLECKSAQAEAISSAVRHGQLLFAGMRTAGKTSDTPTDHHYLETAVHPAFIGLLPETSSIKIKEIEACADLFGVQIPMNLVLSAGNYYMQNLPVIKIDSLSLAGNAENFSGYTYQKSGWFCRNQILHTNSDLLSVSFAYSGSVPNLSASLKKSGVTVQNWNSVETENSCSASLDVGLNQFALLLSAPAYKPLGFRFSIWRNPAVS